METILVTVFAVGYIAIAFEHSTKLDKLIPALLMMAICWATIALGIDDIRQWFVPDIGLNTDFLSLNHDSKMHLLEGTMLHHFGKTAEILVFLMGAMAIVEMIDYFKGFESIKKMIKTKSKIKLLWTVALLGFVLSAIIDNLTATIVLITILRKLISDDKTRMWYAGLIIIAANAGGAWTPIGDVTTTMLWMAKKVTAVKLTEHLFLPSIINILVPLAIASFLPVFKGNLVDSVNDNESTTNKYSKLMLFLGLGLIVFVPVFKTITHLPPYVGMMLSLTIFATVAEFLSNRQLQLSFGGESGHQDHSLHHGPTMKSLSKIEIPSILFFLGILMTVAALESVGTIFVFGETVSQAIPQDLFVILLGASSAIIDNVPLVAASIGMFPTTPNDAHIWHFIAYAAGTGGSMLIIGSAAGVVAMGMEKISFGWYLKRISLLALLGYIAGALLIILMRS